MKKFLIILIILAGIVISSLLALRIVLNPSRLRPQIIKALERTFRRPVEIGSLTVGWNGQITFEARDIAVYSDPDKKLLPILRASKVTGQLAVWPLLKRQIRFSRVLFENPFIYIARGGQEPFLSTGTDTTKKAGSKPASTSGPASAVTVSADSLVVQNGRVRYQNRAGAVSDFIEFNLVDLRIDHFSLNREFPFELKAAWFCETQNIQIKGQCALPDGQNPGVLKKGLARTDLSQWEFERLSAFFPVLKRGPVTGPLTGHLEVQIDHCQLGPQWEQSLKLKLNLSDAGAVLSNLQIPVESIQAMAALDGKRLLVENLSGQLAAGSFRISGSTESLTDPASLVQLHVNVADAELERLTQKVLLAGRARLTGKCSLALNGQARGLAWESFSKSLSGQSRLSLKEGVIMNYNLLKDVSAFVSVIPQAQDIMQMNFPQVFRAKMDDKNTLLRPLDLTARVREGVFYFDSFRLETDLLSVTGSGSVGFDGNVNGTGQLCFDPGISSALVGLVNQLMPIMNNEKQVEFPVKIKGRLPQIKVIPDSRYIITHVLAQQAQQAVNDIVKNPKQGIGLLQGLFQKEKSS